MILYVQWYVIYKDDSYSSILTETLSLLYHELYWEMIYAYW